MVSVVESIRKQCAGCRLDSWHDSPLGFFSIFGQASSACVQRSPKCSSAMSRHSLTGEGHESRALTMETRFPFTEVLGETMVIDADREVWRGEA